MKSVSKYDVGNRLWFRTVLEHDMVTCYVLAKKRKIICPWSFKYLVQYGVDGDFGMHWEETKWIGEWRLYEY